MGSSQQSTIASLIPPAAPGGADLPAGTILLFDRGADSGALAAIPSGWTQYTSESGDLRGYIIKGGTSVSRVTGTPASITTSFGGSSSTHAAHTAGGISIGASAGTSAQISNSAGGAHAHPVTANAPTFPITYPSLPPQPAPGTTNAPTSQGVQGAQVALIRTATDTANIPAGGIVFSNGSVFSGFDRKTWGEAGYPAQAVGVYSVSAEGPTTATQYPPSPRSLRIRGTPYPADPAILTVLGTHGSAGDHQHTGNAANGSAPGGTARSRYTNAGPHTHPAFVFTDGDVDGAVNLNVWQQYKHLLPVVSTTDQPVVSGVIVMYNGASAPTGWNVCDGTNSTPNMVNFFLGYDNNETNSNVTIGTNTVGQTFSPATSPAPPPTAYNASAYPVTLSTQPWPHSHGPISPSPSPTIKTVQHGSASIPHSHTANFTVSFPSGYVPAHITLIFIQKA